VKDLANPSTPLKETVTLPAGSLAHWSNAGSLDVPSKLNGDFRTDTDISGNSSAGRRERELQAWQPDGSPSVAPSGGAGIRGDEATFGPGNNAPNGWDQFAANENLFGVKTTFDESIYTTKIDRSTPDFKERERKAQALANEIMGVRDHL
jgi:PAB1-binding protein PBP1